MFNTPRTVVLVSRAALALAAVGASIVLIGPFQDLEAMVPFGDKAAHFGMFYLLTALAMLALPGVRRADLARTAIILGGLIEVLQLMVGRDAQMADWVADAAGVFGVVGPMQFERMRQLARSRAYESFSVIQSEDRRKRRRRVPAKAEVFTAQAA